MITVKVLNEFGRVTSSADLRLFGGTTEMIHSIEKFLNDKSGTGIHVIITTPHGFNNPTAVWDILHDGLAPHGIRNIRLTVRTPRHTVTVGAAHFSPLGD